MSALGTQQEASQRGPRTGPTTYMISGVSVEFPCKAYPSQIAMMNKVIQGLKCRKNCLLESPTGSGKSLALLCSALAWQRHEAARVMELNAEIDARQAQADRQRIEQEMKRKAEVALESQMNTSKNDVQNGGNATRNSDSSINNVSTTDIPVYDLTDDDDDDDFKPLKRSRTSMSSTLNNSTYTSDSSADAETLKTKATPRKSAVGTDVTENSPYFVPAEKKLTVPKIFFGTRTHNQISQIKRELRKTSYQNTRSVILASRDYACINPTVEKMPNKNEGCRELLQNSFNGPGCLWHAGAKKLASFAALNHVGLSPAYDIEDLVAKGRQHKACPYYVTRFLIQSADIVFCPYNYLIDSNIRRTMNLELDGHVLIFDEAHNMEDASRESSSFSLKQEDIVGAMQDCEKVAASGNEPYAHNEISKLLSTFSQWMDSQEPYLKEQTFNNSAKCWTGTEFLGSAGASGMTEEGIKLQMSYFAAVLEQRDKQSEAIKERGGRRYDEKPVITTQSVGAIENIFRVFQELGRENGRFMGDFRVALLKEQVKRRKNGNAGPLRSVQVLTFNLWCLNPAVSFQFLRNIAHSIVLTSGTLSPMQSFESELETPFSLKLEANHVIDQSQCWAGVIGVGPNNISLNGSYTNASTLQYQDELGQVVYRVCRVVPHGVLCFFPSYKMLENVSRRWQDTGMIHRIQEIKAVITEPREGPQMFQAAMENFYEVITRTTMEKDYPVTGALFLAVCRGKVSEGLDFADNNARAVICVGIPFPNVKDMQVELKREYNSKNRSKGLLDGGQWYEIQAFRALNQALGRCIRHRNDWGAVILVDDRYTRVPRYVLNLPKWIRSTVKQRMTWDFAENSIQQFCNVSKGLENVPVLGAFNSNCGGDQESNNYGTYVGAALGKQNDYKGVSKSSSVGQDNFTSDKGTFANSFSGDGNDDSDFFTNLNEPVTKSTDDDDSLPPSPANKESSPRFSFTLPTTPLNIFSKNTNQKGKKVEKPNLIASMFARQVKSQKTVEKTAYEFNASQVEVGIGTLCDSDSESSSNSRVKRPREKKLKL